MPRTPFTRARLSRPITHLPAALAAATLIHFGLAPAARAADAGVRRAELIGRAVLPAQSFASGPTSGQLIAAANGIAVPFGERQPVQGFSAVLPGPRAGTFYVMADNGFGAKANSPDALLRVYAVEPDFASGSVHPVHFAHGGRLSNFGPDSFITLSDPERRVPFTLVAERASYPGTQIAVAPAIVQGRLLTGGDFDIESFRRAPDGTLWFGDEFGPFLLHTDAAGRVLEAPIALPKTRGLGDNPWVQSPDNPLKPAGVPANLNGSKGLEGMALDLRGKTLYALLEGALLDDPLRTRLLINEFDLKSRAWTGASFAYRLESPAHAIGDFTAIGNRLFLVIERDNNQGAAAAFKKIYKVDLQQVDADGFLLKEEVADLLDIADPEGRGGNGTVDGRFSFPFVTIEDVLPLDAHTLLVINDNNFPFSSGRTPGAADDNEFILLRVPRALPAGVDRR
jgi:hypothetical protein